MAREPRRPRREGPLGEPTRVRRALTADELSRLVASAGRGRGPAYLLAATTGLRRSELASLTWEDVDLEAATVRVRAASAKNRREAVLPLPAGTVAVLGRLRGDEQLPTARVLRSVPNTTTMRKDLTRARIPVATPDGVVDFHALRVTYGTLLARAGVSLAQAQKLMRHSTPVLTANVYVKLQMDDAREAVARIDVGVGAGSAGPRRGGRLPRDEGRGPRTESHLGGNFGGRRSTTPHFLALPCANRRGNPCARRGANRPPARRTGPAGEWARQDSNLRPRDYESPRSCPPRPKKWPSAPAEERHLGYLPRGGRPAPDPPRVRGVPPRGVHGATWAPVGRPATREGTPGPPPPRNRRTGRVGAPAENRPAGPPAVTARTAALPPTPPTPPARSRPAPACRLERVEFSNATCGMS